ncbi:hypothetical protein BDZ97DRAFT_1663888, partial [Flammula alnicola]
QVLSITCDNVSNNDVMIDKLEELLPEFSKVNHTRCFLHVINLVSKMTIKQFDVQKKATGEVSDEEDEDIRELAGDLAYDSEERQTREGLLEESLTGEVSTDDDVTGWIDEMVALSAVDRAALQAPVVAGLMYDS